jgi:hypothetical protein
MTTPGKTKAVLSVLFTFGFLKTAVDGFSIFDKYDKDYYLSKEGYVVFTEKYHLKRGYCCRNGCKHCPYGFDRKTNRMKND